jgi:hypothetical protein
MSGTTDLGPLWCDDFDADLPKLIPDALDAIEGVADVKLWTHCKPTNGRINCPSAWHTDMGLAAFFSTREGVGGNPPGYVTSAPVVRCTFWEAVRDEWCHDSVIVVNGRYIWTPPSDLMMRLMYDLRGWTRLTPAEINAVANEVLSSLSAAADRLRVAGAVDE